MYCNRCGTQLAEGLRYCPACGHPAGAALAPPDDASAARHLRLLAILWIVLSALRLVPALALFTLGAHTHVPPFVRAIMPVIGLIVLAFAVAGFIAAWGLLERHSWARPLTIVLAILALLEVPLGTALGVYSLWVLLPARPGLPGVEPRGWSQPPASRSGDV